MGEISSVPDVPGKLPLRYRTSIEDLAAQLLRGKCTIFLGAGAAVDVAQPDLPTGSELAAELATACELDAPATVPLATAAFYYESLLSRESLMGLLAAKIGNAEIEPSRTIRTLIQIVQALEDRGRAPFVVTTNYDQQFERAYRDLLGRDAKVIIYRGACSPNERGVDLHVGLDRDADKWTPTANATYLYKMHGCITECDAGHLVITEEDYINFLTNALSEDPHKHVLREVRSRLSEHSVLFVGYGLEDWNFRVIFKATAERAQRRKSYAVQLFRPAGLSRIAGERWRSAVDFWGLKKVDIINASAAQFVEHLLHQIAPGVGVRAGLMHPEQPT